MSKHDIVINVEGIEARISCISTEEFLSRIEWMGAPSERLEVVDVGRFPVPGFEPHSVFLLSDGTLLANPHAAMLIDTNKL